MIDLTGKRFGRLTVLNADHKSAKQLWYWRCVCDCGKETIVSGDKLRRGATKSCGCLQDELRKAGQRKTHGMADTRLYTTWCNMKARCNRPSSSMYYRYGARGIRVCEEWLCFEGFKEWSLSTGYSDGMTIERNDIDGDYCPENCRWIPPSEQCLNKSDSHFVTAFGITKTIREWAESSGIKYDTIERRLNAYGWSPEDAVTILPHKKPR